MHTTAKPALPPVLLAGLMLVIPAFYLVLVAANPNYVSLGRGLYVAGAVLVGVELLRRRKHLHGRRKAMLDLVDAFIVLGALASAWPVRNPWPVFEWILRLGYCSVVFGRLTILLLPLLAPNRLVQIFALAGGLLAAAGAGFYWLEPQVHTYADGLWLAFTTGATVGYGDIIPSTPGSRIFAVFMVLLGYALLSIVTASIAALFVGQEDKRIEREFRADIHALRHEIAALRQEIAEMRRDSKSGPLD